MEFIALALSIISLITGGAAFYFARQNQNITKKFFGDDKIKEKITQDLDLYYIDTKKALSDYNEVVASVNRIDKENKNNFSTFAVRRFNPYEEAGGDLSFCFVLLNRNKDGIMITSLHGRERTRIYTRNITNGEIHAESLFDEKETLKEAVDKINS